MAKNRYLSILVVTHHRHTRAVGACRHVSPLDNALLAGPFPFPGGVDTNVLARGSLVTYAAPDTTTLGRTSRQLRSHEEHPKDAARNAASGQCRR